MSHRKVRFRLSVLLFLYAGMAMASAIAARANTGSGASLAQSDCAACHGSKGQGNSQAGFPRLAGLPVPYLEAQLNAFAKGARKSSIMHGQASQLTKSQIKALSVYYAGLRVPPVTRINGAAKRRGQGRQLVLDGMWSKNIPGCSACHGPGARGTAQFPELAGQNAKYLERQLRAFQSGARPPGPDGIMKHVANQLTPSDIKAVATYLADLPVHGPIPASARRDVAPHQDDALPGYFQPPLAKSLPKGHFGQAVRQGFLIFTDTPKYAKKYVGDQLSCSNCHTNAGRQANSSPMWAAWVMYPAYRGKNKKVNDIVMRLQGCFRYSENAQGSPTGHYPPASSHVMIDLESYMYWMAHGAPTGVKMKGRGYVKLSRPAHPVSRADGAHVYAAHCEMCHGSDGQGSRINGHGRRFPALWGPHSFNWGAGMHKVSTAAAFIKFNMPLGNAGSLSLQQAWDVAAYMDSHPRPQDPRFNGNLTETVKRFHHHRKIDYYGKKIDGWVLGKPGTLEKWALRHDHPGAQH